MLEYVKVILETSDVRFLGALSLIHIVLNPSEQALTLWHGHRLHLDFHTSEAEVHDKFILFRGISRYATEGFPLQLFYLFLHQNKVRLIQLLLAATIVLDVLFWPASATTECFLLPRPTSRLGSSATPIILQHIFWRRFAQIFQHL